MTIDDKHVKIKFFFYFFRKQNDSKQIVDVVGILERLVLENSVKFFKYLFYFIF